MLTQECSGIKESPSQPWRVSALPDRRWSVSAVLNAVGWLLAGIPSFLTVLYDNPTPKHSRKSTSSRKGNELRPTVAGAFTVYQRSLPIHFLPLLNQKPQSAQKGDKTGLKREQTGRKEGSSNTPAVTRHQKVPSGLKETAPPTAVWVH